eukprot:TRINITY_DN102010_c0_g1_i1.p1 TRINITY_DN102010_c0_g1~~TRINITY_DN102010_c0_g1_i1.p1  ORF type:complete len:467 (-),score=54.09 TRINITY_DN102010_c0_g1_i1:125-1525(-)
MKPHCRALYVRRTLAENAGSLPVGAKAAVTIGEVPNRKPEDGELLVAVVAAAITASDVSICGGPLPAAFQNIIWGEELSQTPLAEPASPKSSPAFVPGCFFLGKVLQLGASVDGIRTGDPVLGVVDGLMTGAETRSTQQRSQDEALAWGCYRECICIHYSCLLPLTQMPSGIDMPALLAHVPPMLDALLCTTRQLRLRRDESLVVIAPRVADVVFLLQRLLLISNEWRGPLFLVVLKGRAPSQGDLERHPLLRPVISRLCTDDELNQSFLGDFVGLAVEDELKKLPAAEASSQDEALRRTLADISTATNGIGADVILALGLDLMLPCPTMAQHMASLEAPATTTAKRPASSLIRALAGTLALSGRLIVDCPRLELMPSEGEHLWTKGASLAFLNPYCLPLTPTHQGILIHAMAEVLGRVACSDLPIVEAEVSQYRLFEQLHSALEACQGSPSSANALLQTMAVLVV